MPGRLSTRQGNMNVIRRIPDRIMMDTNILTLSE